MVKYKRFSPDLFKIYFNFESIGAITSPTDNSVEIQGHFRTLGDYVSMVWDTDDYGMHEYCKYKSDDDYSGNKLSFSMHHSDNFLGFNDTENPPALVIEYYNQPPLHATLGFFGNKHLGESTGVYDGEIELKHKWIEIGTLKVEYYSNGEYITAPRQSYDVDYIRGRLFTIDNSGVPYQSELRITYEYNTHEKYTLDFDNLYEGTSDLLITEIPAQGIKSVRFPIAPIYYEPENMEMLGYSDEFQVLFSDVSSVGGELNEKPMDMPVHQYRVAEGYDDEYFRNPKRLVESLKMLGYTKLINLYIGASHFYDKKGDAGKVSVDHTSMTLIEDRGINIAFSHWLGDLSKQMRLNDFEDLIVSVSMECLQMPDEWKQYMFDGTPGMTGWVPSTNFYDPNHPGVRKWMKHMTRETLQKIHDNGMKVILQLGEPWWWWQEFVPSEYGDMSTPWPGQPPCFYNDATVERIERELEQDFPIYETSHIEKTNSNEELWIKMQGYLGEYSDMMKSVSREFPNSEYTVLFFPPSVLDVNRVPDMMKTVNTPFDVWDNNQLDYIQIEDYDWIIHRDEQHLEVYPFAWEHMGYRFDQQHYFAGFVLNAEDAHLWKYIEHSGAGALGRGFKEVVVWAGTQVRRDSWTPRRNYYVADTTEMDVEYMADNIINNRDDLFLKDLKGNEYKIVAEKEHAKELNGDDNLKLIIRQQKNSDLDLKRIDALWVINYKRVEYKITHVRQQTKGTHFYIELRATPNFYWDFDKAIIHENHDGHHTANSFFRIVFNNSGYNFVLVDFSPAVDWEGLGKGESRKDLFKRGLDRYNYEFEIDGNTVYLKHLIGNDTNFLYKYKLNASNISKSTDAANYFTHIKGFGNFEEGEEDYSKNAKLKSSYTSPLAEIVGFYEGKPIIDGRITKKSSMDEALEKAVEESLQISIEAKLHDVREMGYENAVPLIGDRVFIEDERLEVNQEIRIYTIHLKENERGEIISCDVTFGSQSIRGRHKASMNSLSKNFEALLTGKLKLPVISLEKIGMDMINNIHAASSEIIFDDDGMKAISKTNPNNIFGVNSEGWYISQDGGRTPKTIATAKGIYADALFAGTLWLTNEMNIESADGYLNVTGSRFVMRSKTNSKNAVEITPNGITIHGFDGRELIVNGVMRGEPIAHIQVFNTSYDGINTFTDNGEFSSMFVVRDTYRGRYLDISGVTRLVGTYESDKCQLDIRITNVGDGQVELFRQRETITGSAEPVDYSYNFRLDLQELYGHVPNYRYFQFYVQVRLVNFQPRHKASFRVNRGRFFG